MKPKVKTQGLEMWGVFSQAEDDKQRENIMEKYDPPSDEDELNIDNLHEN